MNEPALHDGAARLRALDTHRSFLVQAPAGSGKTELLTQRFLKLLAEVDEPERILAITFTLAATAEMRTRVLEALQEARSKPEAGGEPPSLTMARAALKNAVARGWKLLEQPQQLNIQTIDSLCLTIAHETPLLSRLGGSLTPTEYAEPMYALAARRTLARLGGDREELSAAIRALLQLRDVSLADCERMIAAMLARRDQWGRVLPLSTNTDWAEVRAALERPLQREHERVLESARRLFARHPVIAGNLVELLRYACGNLRRGGVDSPLLKLHGITGLEQLTELAQWNCLCDFLLTAGNTWRSRVTAKHGFPAGKHAKGAKQPFLDLIGTMDQEPEFHEVLCRLRHLPPAGYDEEQWQLLRHMLVAMRFAAAELRVIFAERNLVDFVELGLAARQVLCDDQGEPTEKAADLASRWRHLLVDEFQDTSRGQYELLTMLVGAWEANESGTCFLVGDPMQSIYMFRQAEVELFERTRRRGLGEGTTRLELIPMQLHTNFRSHSGIVDRLNEIFRAVFAQNGQGDVYRVPFACSTASEPGAESVLVTARLLRDKATLAEVDAARIAEAEDVVRVIRKHWPEVVSAKGEGGRFQIAVLVRARTHLIWIAKNLRDAAIPFRAVEVEELTERQEVLDLTALVRALLHPMDRIAWLTILRAPWCGLTLRDLHILCGSDDPEAGRRPLLELLRTRIPLLSEDGQVRASRVAAVLEDALSGKHGQVSFSRWVERTWLTLGGRECVDGTGYENARVFFDMLGQLAPDGTQLDEQLERLFAEPDPQASEGSGVQLMTIHKAKGLGFDVVIVPGLDRKPASDEGSLLRWLERTLLEGPEEREEPEFLVAPIGRKGAYGDPLYRWIGQQKQQRESEEAKRLLYVACTRARQELHLFGTAIVKTDANGLKSLVPGDSRSLLRTAWPALESTFTAAGRQAEAEDALLVAGDQPPKTLQLRRLPADWKPLAEPEYAAATVSLTSESASRVEAFERPAGSRTARAFGVVVHALFEELANTSGGDAAGLLAEVAGWRPRALAMLRNAGMARAQAERQSAEVVRALSSALEDEMGRWILASRKDAQTEASWSAWAGPEGAGELLHTLRGDRIFRAGAAPGSRETTHTWIVDYKTAHHGAAGLDLFLAREREKYSGQLSAYAKVMRKVHGEPLQLRLALYYPLLRRLEWWEG